MGEISVTWLELFFDLSVVLAVHNVSVPMENNISLISTLSYFLRIMLLWFIWNFMSTTINLANKRRSFEYNIEQLGADTWLGWRETLCIILTTCFVTLMSNAAYIDNNEYYYGYFCLAEIAVLIDTFYQFQKFGEAFHHETSYTTADVIRKSVLSSVFLLTLAILVFSGYVMINNDAIYSIFASFLLSFIIIAVKSHLRDLKFTPAMTPRKTMVEQWNEHKDHEKGMFESASSSSPPDTSQSSSQRPTIGRGTSARISVIDKKHLQERYGLLTILLLGESVGVSANALPKKFTAEAFAVAIASFLAAFLCWFLYFAVSPSAHRRLPIKEPLGTYRHRMFKVGNVLSTVLFCYAHLGLVASLPLLASGFSRLVEASGDQSEEAEEKSKRESKLLVSLSAAAFLIFSGLLASLGEDPAVEPGKVPARKMNPQQRAGVRCSIGVVLGLLAILSCVMVDGEVWAIEIWGGIVCLAFALSAYLETRPSDLREVPVLRLSVASSVGGTYIETSSEKGAEEEEGGGGLSAEKRSSFARYNLHNQHGLHNRESGPRSTTVALHSPKKSTKLENDPTFFGDCNPMRLTTPTSTTNEDSIIFNDGTDL